MDLLQLLDSRKHVHRFKEDVPPRDDIEEILSKAWRVTPSKNNFMPYEITILGPDAKQEKLALLNLCKANKKFVNENATKGHTEDGDNVNFLYLKDAPYTIIFSQRVCEPSPFIQRTINNENDYFEQMHELDLSVTAVPAAVEVGLFAANLSAFALEKGIQVNYNGCFPNRVENWGTLPIIKHNPLLIGAMGYCSIPRRNKVTEQYLADDLKPNLKEMLKWILEVK